MKPYNNLMLLEEDINLTPNYDADIDGLSGTGNVNYGYDALGNLTQDLSEEIQEIKWNAYGKVVEVIRTTNNHNKPDLQFVYDAFGQRIKKIVKKRVAGVLSHEKDWQETFYVRDAQGNVMAMYDHTSTFFANNNNYVNQSFSIAEWNLYGSSRLGTRSIDKTTDVVVLAARNYNWIGNTVTNEYILPTASFTYKKYRLLGAKTFELTNHLGNVIATISDRKLMVEDAQNLGYVHHYKPEILSIGEQYAFGMSMPGRTFSVEDYRYGFNGKAEENDISGEENTYDFADRLYNVRTGRWFSVDDLYFDYIPISPYAFALNSPIALKDADGNEVVDANGNKVEISITKAKNGEYVASYAFVEGTNDATKDQFYANAARVIDAMMDVPHSRRLVRQANKTSRKVHIEIVNKEYFTDKTIPTQIDAPLGLTYTPEDNEYSLNSELKEKNVWSILILEKNIELSRNEVIENGRKSNDKICIGGIEIKLPKVRYDVVSRFSLSNLRGIIGSHEVRHFLTKNRGGDDRVEKKPVRSHQKVARQKTRKHNRENKHTRYKNPRFL